MTSSTLTNAMLAAAHMAGESLARDFSELGGLRITVKGPSDFVSAADVRAEQIVFDALSAVIPGAGFLMEERGQVDGAGGGAVWIVDPLDGTTNFLHGIPHFAVSIGLQQDGELVAGVVHNPISGDTFAAERGRGAFLNGGSIQVAKRSRLEECVIATGVPHRGRGDHEAYLRQLARVIKEVAGIRRAGSAALDCAWVAAGRYDGFWEEALNPWDLAGGIAIIREAGGAASDMSGGQRILETGGIIAANEAVRRALQDVLE